MIERETSQTDDDSLGAINQFGLLYFQMIRQKLHGKMIDKTLETDMCMLILFFEQNDYKDNQLEQTNQQKIDVIDDHDYLSKTYS